MGDVLMPFADFDAQEWADASLCSQIGGDGWFPEQGTALARITNAVTAREAKKICATCPVRTQCLQFALDHDERWGIWGGLSERERRALKKAAS